MCKVEPQYVELEHDIDVGGNAGNVQGRPSYPTVPVIARCCDDVVRETRFELPGSWEGISYALVEYCSPRDSPLRWES